MATWTYFLITLVAIAVAVVFIIAVRFFRTLYFMIEEVDARLIQIRDIINTLPPGQDSNEAKVGPSETAGPQQP